METSYYILTKQTMTNKGKCPCSCHNPEAPTAPFLCMTGVCYQCSKEGMQKPAHPEPFQYQSGIAHAIPTEDTVFRSVHGKDCRPAPEKEDEIKHGVIVELVEFEGLRKTEVNRRKVFPASTREEAEDIFNNIITI
jgi:hypothetical protein